MYILAIDPISFLTARMSLFGGGAVVTNAEGKPIKLAVAYDNKVHNEVYTFSIRPFD